QGFTLADPGDPGTLAERMGRLLDNAACARMGEAARALAAEHSFDRQADEFLALYHEVKQSKQRRDPLTP
ncbi:MAG TPA: hypothetical protein VG733_01480, partial [Chthoniobacteraceae bacterium]|nr:hypothetical protein [Chthoniobacteraceae bacterium]